MGKLQAIIKIVTKKNITRKQLALSVVSLLLATVILVSATVCWYAIINSTGTTPNMKLDVGNGLRVNDLGESIKDISDNSYLLPASSVDGRNIFFSADGSFDNQTESITYRSANAGDKNYAYAQMDFELTAEANNTSIFLDTELDEATTKPKTYLYFKGWDNDTEAVANGFANAAEAREASKALRSAIWYQGITDGKPIVFTPQNVSANTNAVSEIDRTTGIFLDREKQIAVPFRDYIYGKRQIANLNQSEARRFSYIIWIEGTLEKYASSVSGANTFDIQGKKIDFSLTFTTSWDNTETIKFVDTDAKAVTNYLNESAHKTYSLVLNYDNPSHNISNMKFKMYKDSSDTTGKTWYCKIPGTAYNNLTFQIVDGTDTVVSEGGVDLIWEQSESGISTKNRGDSTKYIVERLQSGAAFSPRGRWYDGEMEDKGNGSDEGGMGGLDDDDW